MQHVFLGIGGNLGDMEATMKAVAIAIDALPDSKEVRFSRIYRTTPVSDLPQPDYLNCVCSLLTTLAPIQLLKLLQNIEVSFGKKCKPKNAPREIDIDILFYGDQTIAEEELIIPHPRWKERLFVLVPLAEFIECIGSCVLQQQIQKLHLVGSSQIELLNY